MQASEARTLGHRPTDLYLNSGCALLVTRHLLLMAKFGGWAWLTHQCKTPKYGPPCLLFVFSLMLSG
jgi:hypothetical protein